MTTQTHIQLESGLEHDLLRKLDRLPSTAWLVAQPFRLTLPLKRKAYRLSHIPDLLSVADTGAVTVWDVRPADRRDTEFELKSNLTGEACSQVGWEYEVFGGLGPVLKTNLLWLHAYRRVQPWYTETLRYLRKQLWGPAFTIAEVLSLETGSGHVTSAMWHAIWSGQIIADLEEALSRPSVVRWSEPAT